MDSNSLSLSLPLTKPSTLQLAPRYLLGPAIGALVSGSLAWLVAAELASAGSIYAALCLGLGLVFLGLAPSCRHGGVAALTLALGHGGLGLLAWQHPVWLHTGLALQTVIAALWLLREQSQGERAIAGLVLGLSTGAVVGLGWLL